jgi:hypothetical protein
VECYNFDLLLNDFVNLDLLISPYQEFLFSLLNTLIGQLNGKYIFNSHGRYIGYEVAKTREWFFSDDNTIVKYLFIIFNIEYDCAMVSIKRRLIPLSKFMKDYNPNNDLLRDLWI